MKYLAIHLVDIMCVFISPFISMSIFDIDYDNLVVHKDTILNRTVFIIDNFYKYPFQVLRRIENTNLPPSSDFYPGNRGDFVPRNRNEGMGAWNHVNELKLLLRDHGFEYSKFVLNKNSCGYELLQFSELVSDVLQNKKYQDVLNINSQNAVGCNPHTDADAFANEFNILACVCYLSRVTHGGTRIYRIKHNGTYCTDQRLVLEFLNSLKEKLEGVSSESEREEIIFEYFTNDYKNRMLRTTGLMNESDDHYELLYKFPMKFNRMIVYEGDLLHSIYIQDENFFKINDRKTVNYTLSTKWEYEDDDENKLKSKDLQDLKAEIVERMSQRLQSIN